MMKDGGSIGVRLNLGEVGIEFFHESKLTSGDPIIRTDVDQGVHQWLFKADTDGDGEPDTSVEPTEKAVELEEEAVALEEEAAEINEEAVDGE
jgi:hypothetical protein